LARLLTLAVAAAVIGLASLFIVTLSSSGGVRMPASGSTVPNPGNGLVPEATFFPIGVWNQTPEDSAGGYRQLGVTVFVGLYHGITPSALATLRDSGQYLIGDQPPAPAVNGDVIKAWQSQPDEPDTAGNGPQPPSQVIATYKAIKAADPSRPVFVNFGPGVADITWLGGGANVGHPERYPEYAKGGDLLSEDTYPINGGHPITAVADGVDNLRRYSDNAKPVYAFIETTAIEEGNPKPTPEDVRAEVWLALIHGANGIVYFCNVFSPSFDEAAMLHDPVTSRAVADLDSQITSLAPVLNADTVTNDVTVSTPDRVDVMEKHHGGKLYLMTESVGDHATSARFTMRERLDGTITVIGENRRIPVVKGRFSDSYDVHGVHLYEFSPR